MVYNHLIPHFLFLFIYIEYKIFYIIASKKHYKTLGNSKNIRVIFAKKSIFYLAAAGYNIYK